MITRPVLIVGCPRSGTTLLFNSLSEVSSLWSIGYESKAIVERHHHPRAKGWESGVLTAADLTVASGRQIVADFERQAAPGTFWRRVNRLRRTLASLPSYRALKRRGRTTGPGSAASSRAPQQGLELVRAYVRLRNRLRRSGHRPIRLLEKTPENCLRLDFLLALFPDARVIYLTRDGRDNVNSLIEGWRQPHLFPGYDVPIPLHIPGDRRGRWAFTLIPGWRDLIASPLEEICAWQWRRCNEAVLAHRAANPTVAYLTVPYEDLVARPAAVLASIADFLDVDYAVELARFAAGLPQVNVVSAPGAEKWRSQNPEAIAAVLPILRPLQQQLGYPSSVS